MGMSTLSKLTLIGITIVNASMFDLDWQDFHLRSFIPRIHCQFQAGVTGSYDHGRRASG